MKEKTNIIQATNFSTIDRHPREGGDPEYPDVACNVSTSSASPAREWRKE